MRKISKSLLDRMLTGDLQNLFEYIKSDRDLRLEVRSEGDAFVYYRKGKALGIKKLEVDKKYGNVPATSLAVSEPRKYFNQIKTSIDTWLLNKKRRNEFDTQQNVAISNQNYNDKYIVLDMEYRFEQSMIKKEERKKAATFDLLGIDKASERIVFFEVKRGINALNGKSGIESHIKDFEEYMLGKHSEVFRKNLMKDVENIIQDKTKLSLLENINFLNAFNEKDPDLVFIFHPEKDSEIEIFSSKLKNQKYSKFMLVNGDNYKLN